MRTLATVVAFAATALAAESAAAQTTADGSYGRVEGDLLFVASVGAVAAQGGPQLETHLSLLYLSTAGGYFRYVESFENDASPFARLIAVGFDLRPLFLGRYGLDLERGPAHLDLFLDSLSLVIGPTWSSSDADSPGGAAFDASPGLELGAGIEVPFLPSANGPYLGILALARFGPDDIAGTSEADWLDRGSSLMLTFAWHQVFDAGLVDLRDPPRTPR